MWISMEKRAFERLSLPNCHAQRCLWKKKPKEECVIMLFLCRGMFFEKNAEKSTDVMGSKSRSEWDL